MKVEKHCTFVHHKCVFGLVGEQKGFLRGRRGGGRVRTTIAFQKQTIFHQAPQALKMFYIKLIQFSDKSGQQRGKREKLPEHMHRFNDMH